MEDMKTLTIDGVEYEVIDGEARRRMTDAESDIEDLRTGKANNEDVPSKASDLENDLGYITEAPVTDVMIEGESIVHDGNAEIPMATGSQAGVVMFDPVTELQRADIYTGGEEMYPYRLPMLNGNQEILAEQLPAATTSKKGAMSAADKAKLNDIFNLVYPVGSIYMSVNPTNPAELFGGTWAEWGNGRVPVGVEASDTSFNTVEKTGGEKEHTLTIAELASHSHEPYSTNPIGFQNTRFVVTDTSAASTRQVATGTSGRYVDTTEASGQFHHYQYTDTTGMGRPHNNLQPYITCYMWKRTA